MRLVFAFRKNGQPVITFFILFLSFGLRSLVSRLGSRNLKTRLDFNRKSLLSSLKTMMSR